MPDTTIQFTFDPAKVATEDFDRTRALVGDIDPTDPLIDDRIVESYLTLYGASEAAPRLAEHLAAKFARLVTKRTGDLTTNYSDLAKHYKNLAAQLRQQLALGGVRPYAGGLSFAEREEDRQDEDLPQPVFEIGMNDNGRQSTRDDESRLRN